MSEAAPQYRPLIRDMPSDERPRERLRLRGASTLSSEELIAILLRTGSNGENVLDVARRLLARCGGLSGLARISFAELCTEKAVGEAKAAQVLAALELGKRMMSAQPGQRSAVRCAEDVYLLMGADMAFLEQEHLRVILLNTRNQVLGTSEVYKGNVHSAVVRVAEVFRDAVREGCPNLIVVHNHPSGDPSPSPDDVAVTKQLFEAGRSLGIELVDHVVIGRSGKPPYASLKELGLGFPKG